MLAARDPQERLGQLHSRNRRHQLGDDVNHKPLLYGMDLDLVVVNYKIGVFTWIQCASPFMLCSAVYHGVPKIDQRRLAVLKYEHLS